MKIQYFSEITNKVYDSVQALEKAEAEVKKREEHRRKLIEEREVREHELQEARDHYRTLLTNFVNDYPDYLTPLRSIIWHN